ncbi:MAG: hypothetical protein AMXMBFR56_18080 [Polyangiaceae bacterium]
MVTPRGQRELERTASWRSVRSGLGWLIGLWLVLTLAGVGVQLQSMRLAPAVAAKDPGALVVMTMVSMGYQAFYFLVSLGLVVALLRVTRVPPATGAVTPALVATASFVLVGLLSFALLFGLGGGSSEGISGKQMWVLVAAARAAGLTALILALTRMSSFLGARVPQAVTGAAFAFVAVDTGVPLYRLLASAADAQPSGQRAFLLVIQIALAALVIDFSRRVRRAAASLASAELEAPPEPEPEDEDDEEEAEDEPPPSERKAAPQAAPPPSGVAQNLVALLVFSMLALFPLWDAVTQAQSVGALTDAVRGAPGTETPSTTLLFGAGAVFAALLVRKLVATSPYGARGVFALALLVAFAYAAPRAYDAALWRSHQVDSWPVCETGLDVEGNLPNVESIYRGPYDGPRLPTGEPCTLAAERRDQHGINAPRGEFSDGIVQIGTRFPDDRRRVLWGALGWLLVSGLAATLIWRAAAAPRPALEKDRRDVDEPVSETSPEDDSR